MTSHELARWLLARPDLPVHVLNDDYSRSDVTQAKTHLAVRHPGGRAEPAAIELHTGQPDWTD